MRHVKFLAMNLVLLGNLLALGAGGPWLWVSFLGLLALSSPADEIGGDDRSLPASGSARWYSALLYLTLPLLFANWLMALHYVAPGDPLGLKALLSVAGADLGGAIAVTGPLQGIGGVLALGLLIGGAGTNVAHELIHRTGSPAALIVGRWLLAFSFDTTFSIEHVHGHHRHVATPLDPASARRGEPLYRFALRSFVEGNRSAFRIEAERLRRKGRTFLDPSNRALSGQIMSLLLLGVAFVVAGGAGLALALVCGLQGKFYLEAVNYIEHYGLVRVPGTRVEPRHSWNCYRGISSALLYNLPRHSDHHCHAAKPYWTLRIEEDAPTLPFGYMTMILAALVPPVFMRLMDPHLADWDRRLASQSERLLLFSSANGGAALARSRPDT